jgi:hypothetical protein
MTANPVILRRSGLAGLFKCAHKWTSADPPKNFRLRLSLNPLLLLITPTKSGFYLEIGPDMQESCF